MPNGAKLAKLAFFNQVANGRKKENHIKPYFLTKKIVGVGWVTYKSKY